jgi:hypothetical protein
MENRSTITTLLGCLLFSSNIQALPINEVEPNNSISQAQNIDRAFSLDYNSNVTDLFGNNTSTILPHAEILGTGDGTDDFFSFTTPSNAFVILDIDGGAEDGTAPTAVDTTLRLYDPTGLFFTGNDDCGQLTSIVDPGSSGTEADSCLQTTVSSPGLWTVEVSEFGGLTPLHDGATYTLNVSVENHTVPNPKTIMLFAGGLLLIAGLRNRQDTAV